jgi:hypothetical protein
MLQTLQERGKFKAAQLSNAVRFGKSSMPHMHRMQHELPHKPAKNEVSLMRPDPMASRHSPKATISSRQT